MGAEKQEVRTCEADTVPIKALTPYGPHQPWDLQVVHAAICPVSFTLTGTPTHPDQDQQHKGSLSPQEEIPAAALSWQGRWYPCLLPAKSTANPAASPLPSPSPGGVLSLTQSQFNSGT